jgi:hypothetical protein
MDERECVGLDFDAVNDLLEEIDCDSHVERLVYVPKRVNIGQL